MNVSDLNRSCGASDADAPVLLADPGGERRIVSANFRDRPNPALLLSAAAAAACEPVDAIPREVKRVITSHRASPLNEAIELVVYDDPGAGGMNHVYGILVPHSKSGESIKVETAYVIRFQNGPIKEAGVNGISNEVLLAIVVDRLEGAQRGPFACKDNDDALGLVKGGLNCLLNRTLKRLSQGVEGTSQQHAEAPAPVDPAPTGQDHAANGKILGPGRPYPVPAMEPTHIYIVKPDSIAAIREGKSKLSDNAEWFDTDNGDWWKVSETMIDWASVGAIRVPVSVPTPSTEPVTAAAETPAVEPSAPEAAPVSAEATAAPVPAAADHDSSSPSPDEGADDVSSAKPDEGKSPTS